MLNQGVERRFLPPECRDIRTVDEHARPACLFFHDGCAERTQLTLVFRGILKNENHFYRILGHFGPRSGRFRTQDAPLWTF